MKEARTSRWKWEAKKEPKGAQMTTIGTEKRREMEWNGKKSKEARSSPEQMK
jgi:hypothetical protein